MEIEGNLLYRAVVDAGVRYCCFVRVLGVVYSVVMGFFKSMVGDGGW